MKKKTKYPTHVSYVDSEYQRVFDVRDPNKSKIDVRSYKGFILMNVESRTLIGPAAWLRGEDFDTLIKLMKEAKKVWLREYRATGVALKCAPCHRTGGGVCEKHQYLLREPRTRPRKKSR